MGGLGVVKSMCIGLFVTHVSAHFVNVLLSYMNALVVMHFGLIYLRKHYKFTTIEFRNQILVLLR